MRSQPTKATQQQTKTYNSQLVLKTIYDHKLISRAEVARVTHLTRTSVSEMVTELQERGLVEEVGQGQSGGGRSPIMLGLVPDARHVVAVDLANDEFHGAVINLRNEISFSSALAFTGPGGNLALALLYQLLDQLLARTDRPVLGIGIGTPGLVDTPNGIVARAVNLEWRDLPLGKLLRDRYNVPVYVANDSQVAALAIYMAADRPGDGSMVVIKGGHGLGAGVILNGQLFQGDSGGAGEIGHVVVTEGGRRCLCGNAGCLETIVSERGIVQQAQESAQADPTSLLHQLAPDLATLCFGQVVRAAQAADPAAMRVVRETGRCLGIAAANLVGVLNVRRIVIAGSLTRFGRPLAAAIQQEMTSRALPSLARQCRIELYADNPDIVLMGASALLLTNELGLSLAR